ncbi:STAS domain-containing protein [Wenzhouxiangella sp. XN79A]|uniref:STAS domain-containing protein n=1 Tax=Wenzhouxiangella sp. XN79A TaxID=2724193 RepID=UPI00144A992C|nr:STAS domain-containing protein [Wenzhouxiangella sp. XN79A]NKI35813.1 STAS domain-containing protein [Wenzhouxiangella sp. XN79A]
MSDTERYRVDGALTKDEVPALWRTTRGWRTDGGPACIDLADVEQADASGVALLLEWAAWARERGQTVRFDHVPEGLRTIAALSQVDELLGLKEAPTE